MKIYKYSVTWHNKKGDLKSFQSNCIETTHKKSILNNGQLWEQTRYRAMVRLKSIYQQLKNKGMLPATIDYPNLIN